MMDCRELSNVLVQHFASQLQCIVTEERMRIVTPFQRPGGDLIDIYVREQSDGSFVVSDLGESIGFLVSMGYDPREGGNSSFLLRHIRDAHGVDLQTARGVVRLEVERDGIGEAVQRCLDASIAISHMLYLARSSAPVTLGDEVETSLVQLKVSYRADARIKGESGRVFRVDFAVRGAQSQHDGLIRMLSAESTSGRLQAVNAAYRLWSEVGKLTAFAASVVDDRYQEWPTEDMEALTSVSTVYHWGSQEQRLRFEDDVQRFAVGL